MSGIRAKFRNKQLRNPTKAELIMLRLLRGMRIGYRRQMVVDSPTSFYILDIYLPKHRIALEVDGLQHLMNPDTVESDRVRDMYLNELGIDVMRVSNVALTNPKYRRQIPKLLRKRIEEKHIKQSKFC